MSLDVHLWEALEQHGLSEAHLRFLLRLLQCQRNGSFQWNYVNGHLTQCHAHMAMPSRSYELERIAACLFPEHD